MSQPNSIHAVNPVAMGTCLSTMAGGGGNASSDGKEPVPVGEEETVVCNLGDLQGTDKAGYPKFAGKLTLNIPERANELLYTFNTESK